MRTMGRLNLRSSVVFLVVGFFLLIPLTAS